MLEWAAHGARELDWIVAEKQLAGRGRQGREWVSPSGNLYATTLVRLRDGDPPAPTLSLVAAIAAHHAVKSSLLGDIYCVRIKWPNDIMIDGAKVAGLLLERGENIVVVGFGINIVSSPKDIGRPTTFLTEHSNLIITAESVHRDLATYFKVFFQKWRSREQGGLEWVRSAWLQCAYPIGTAISFNTHDSKLTGFFEGIDETGNLRIRLADGESRVMHAGDVFLL